MSHISTRRPGRDCQACRHFEFRQDYDEAGDCRRYPPQVPDRDSVKFPAVMLFDWCGEFSLASIDERSPHLPLPSVPGIYAVWKGYWGVEFIYKDPAGFYWYEADDERKYVCASGVYVLMQDTSEFPAWREMPMHK